MNKGLTVLAKVGTTERIVVFLNPLENNLPKLVSEKYGGTWVRVGELCLSDALKFNSEEVYQGFDNRESDNYCQGNLQVKAFQSQLK